MTVVHGKCIAEFELLRSVFERSLELGHDLGASVAVTIDGELVVDLWGGVTPDPHTEWGEHTIANVWSTTKLMTSLAVLRLTEAGVDLDDPVARFWPEFGQAGKSSVTVAQVMSHTSGVAGWDEPISLEDLFDQPKLASLLETQMPWWLPGQAAGYHPFSHGVILAEVVRRVTGKSIGQFFQDEIATPMNADFFIGLPESEEGRVSSLTRLKPWEDATWSPPFAMAARFNPNLTGTEPRLAAWRRAEIPSANGQGNARSVARIQSILACRGEQAGSRYFKPEIAERALQARASGVDLTLGTPLTWALGWALPSHDYPVSPSTTAGFWGGMGGSYSLVDLDHRMTMAFVMNRLGDHFPGQDPRTRRLTVALYADLANLRKAS